MRVKRKCFSSSQPFHFSSISTESLSPLIFILFLKTYFSHCHFGDKPLWLATPFISFLFHLSISSQCLHMSSTHRSPALWPFTSKQGDKPFTDGNGTTGRRGRGSEESKVKEWKCVMRIYQLLTLNVLQRHTNKSF